MEEKLRGVFVEVFQLDPAEVGPRSSAETVKQWDSLGHLRLVTAIEQAFGIQLTTEQIMVMRDYGKILEIVGQNGGGG